MAEQGIVMKDPVHPGEFIRCEIIEELGLSVKRAAAILGVSRPALSALLNERGALTPEMAIRIEKAFGASMETLMRMQHAYDIAQARQRAGGISVQRYVPPQGLPQPRTL